MTVLPSHSEEMYYSKDNVVIRVSCFFGEEFFLDLGWESLAPPFCFGQRFIPIQNQRISLLFSSLLYSMLTCFFFFILSNIKNTPQFYYSSRTDKYIINHKIVIKEIYLLIITSCHFLLFL